MHLNVRSFERGKYLYGILLAVHEDIAIHVTCNSANGQHERVFNRIDFTRLSALTQYSTGIK